MPTQADDVREELRRLSVPPESPRFFEKLRGELHAHDRRAARQWRVASISLAAVAASAVAAAAVLAGVAARAGAGPTVVIDRTISCRVAPTHAVYLSAWVTRQNPYEPPPGQVAPGLVGVTTWPRVNPSNRNDLVAQFAFNAAESDVHVDSMQCGRTRSTVRFGPARLSPNGTDTRTFVGGIDQVCTGSPRVLIHYRIVETSGLPRTAQVGIRDDSARATPLAYVEWSPKRVTTFTNGNCVPFTSIRLP